MPLDPRRVKSLFQAALDLPDPADRPAFLDRECGDDQELRARLDELLAAFDHPASALDRPLAADPQAPTLPDGQTAPGTAPSSAPTVDLAASPAGSAPTVTAPPRNAVPLIGSVIAGRYKLLQEIGEGGMGTVCIAEQTQPVSGQVALKLIKAGMDSRDRAGPVRGGAPGPGPDGPPQHRQGPRRRHAPTAAAPSSSWNWSRASR